MKNNVNTTGYKKGTKTESNPYNVIPSNKITMKKVDKKVLAIKLDEDGLPIGMKFMDPGKEYNFEDAESVMEIPKHQTGYVKQNGNGASGSWTPNYRSDGTPFTGFEKWVMEQERTSPYNQIKEHGFQNYMKSEWTNSPLNKTIDWVSNWWQGDTPNQAGPGQDNTPNQAGPGQDNTPLQSNDRGSLQIPESTFTNNPYGVTPVDGSLEGVNQGAVGAPHLDAAGARLEDEVPTVALDDVEYDTDIDLDEEYRLDRMEKENAWGKDLAKENEKAGFGKENFEKDFWDRNIEDPANAELTNPEDDLKLRERPNIQFFNPYGGTDIPGAAVGLGSAIENKSTLGIIGNAAKLATGLGRNVVGGMGTQRANNTAMEEYNKNLRKGLDGPVKYGQAGGEVRNIEVRHIPGVFMEKGGRIKKEELLTGEYLQGVDQDMPEQMAMVDGEVEAGEYYQTNQGDIAEVVGNKHSGEGEKVPMEEGDRVLTDHTKLGAKNAKDIRDNYDIEVRAKDTYSKVLDKFRSKIGLDKLIKEEEQILKKLEEQDKEDLSDTAGINMHFLENKLAEIRQKKEPIEQVRKILYDKLFNMQEADKPKEEQEENKFQPGGEYGENLGLKEVRKGQRGNDIFYGNVTQEDFFDTIKGNPWYDWSKFNPGNPEDVAKFQKAAGIQVDGKFGEQTASVRFEKPPKEMTIEEMSKAMEDLQTLKDFGKLKSDPGTPYPTEGATEATAAGTEEEKEKSNKRALNVIGLPDQYPMVPGGMEPHLKNQRRFDTLDATKINMEPYLQEIYAQDRMAKSQTEGYTPAIAAAMNQNITANTQKAISRTVGEVDARNLGNEFNVDVQNVQTQRMEENAGVQDNLSYEQRQMMAKAKTEEEYKNYFDKTQQVNMGNYATINALNNANARYSDIQFDGNSYITSPNPINSGDIEYRLAQLVEAEEARKRQEELDKKKKTRTV